ncbi:MAG: TIGR04084 family radical SAM/SPASM domain-containing protein [Deltaproteobacteria bacterium]|nr:TIGR04084 family radical SAM/SPASM domain-containing protein [Deltaproteobacteria bacterium]
MYYLVYLTERCNLACAYCESPGIKRRLPQDASFDLEALIRFLAADPELSLWFFGGEPLLRADLVAALLARLRPVHVMLQTNGFFLDRLSDAALAKIDVIAVSLDGPRPVTDRGRGAGTYDTVLREVAALRKRPYAGHIDVRLTVNPGTEVQKVVQHFLGECEVAFDAVHWQLNALFHPQPWVDAKATIRKWFARSYNPQVSALVALWAEALAAGRLIQIVPFARLMHSLLTHETMAHLRCGAGSQMWAVTTDGSIFPCPALRIYPQHKTGSIETMLPADLGRDDVLTGPCASCEVRALCGGRCLYANRHNEWDAEGFALVCDSVKHLIHALEAVVPVAAAAIDRGQVRLEDFRARRDYEVIP